MSNSKDYKNEIEETIGELGLGDYCIFSGNVDNVEIYYNICDITVLPSLFEGTPNVVLESMACGVPVIATDVSDNRFIIKDGETGYVVPINNPEILSKYIFNLLQDEPKRRGMGIKARERAVEEFSCQRLAEKTADVYDEVLEIRKLKKAMNVAI